MIRVGLLGLFLLFVMTGEATQAVRFRLQASVPWTSYDEFVKLPPPQRRERFNIMSAGNRATIVQTHVKRWLDRNRGRLSASEVAIFEEIITFLERARTSGGFSDDRGDALVARMRCRVADEDVREATNVFGDATKPSDSKVGRRYLSQAQCWIDWMIESVVDYIPATGK